MSALIRQLALVSESKQIPPGDVMKVSAACRSRHPEIWHPSGIFRPRIDSFDKLTKCLPGPCQNGGRALCCFEPPEDSDPSVTMESERQQIGEVLRSIQIMGLATSCP
jgi:hypothetical protein